MDVYSIPLLRAWYDLYVLGLNNHVIWRCPTSTLVDLYRRHASSNHLEVGVGSGYFLDRSTFRDPSPRIVLLDRNPSCLATTARRIARFSPACVEKDLFNPPLYDGEPFDSIGLTYVLHCLPGPMARKLEVMDQLRALLRPGGVLFGATLLPDDRQRHRLAEWHMRLFNAMGVFGNSADTLDELTAGLGSRFRDVSVRRVGSAALFSASA